MIYRDADPDVQHNNTEESVLDYIKQQKYRNDFTLLQQFLRVGTPYTRAFADPKERNNNTGESVLDYIKKYRNDFTLLQ